MPRKRKQFHRDQHRDGISIDRLPSGSYRARVWDAILRKYRTVTKDTEDEAMTEAGKLRAKFSLGQDNAASCVVADVWKVYKAERFDDGKAKERTKEAMLRVVEGLIAAGATNMKAPGFRGAVARFFSNLALSRTKAADGRVAVSTRKRMLGQVNALVNFARVAGWLVADPLAGYSPVGAREQDDQNREVFSLREIRRLIALDRLEDPVWVHSMLCLYTGLRDAEARRLTWADYEAERAFLWIRRGKGNKRRNIEVQAELAALLARVSAATGPTAKVASMPSAPIAKPAKNRSLGAYRHYALQLEDAGIERNRGVDEISGMPRQLTRHSLRHSYCAAMLATGVPGDNLRILMGHKVGAANLTELYGAQMVTFKAEVEAEGWQRGRLSFAKAPNEASTAAQGG